MDKAPSATQVSWAETAFQESEGKFRTLFEESLDAIGVSRDGLHIFVNPAYLELFGYTRAEELLGLPVLQVLAPSARAEVAERIQRRARGQPAPSKYEARGLRRDGTEFDFEVSVSVFEFSGAPHTLVIVRDITARQASQRELETRARQQEAVAALGQKALGGPVAALPQHAASVVQQILDVSHVAILDILPGGKGLLPRAAAGWPPHQAGHWRMDASVRYFPGYALSCEGPVIARCFASDERFEAGFPAEYGIMAGMAQAIRSAEHSFGVICALSGTAREFSSNDVHFLQSVAYVLSAAAERQKAEADLRERELLLRRVLDTNPNLILVKDRNGVILLANEAMAACYGAGLEDVLGRRHADLHRRWNMSGDEVEQWLRDDREVIDAGQPKDLVESFTHRDGSVHWYRCRKLPLSLGPVRDYVLIVSADITAQKNAADEIRKLNIELERRVNERTRELAQANEELEAFSYSISHDLRSPLRAIDGFAQMIREDFAAELSAEALRLFEVISSNAQKMGELIDDLLQFSRLSRAEFQRGNVDMYFLARSVIEELRGLERDRAIDIEVERLPQAFGDTAMLRQVWVNLISNALKFTRKVPGPASLKITGRIEKAEAIFSIQDNGVGFDPRYAHKLFQVFQRLHRAEDFDGTGVGLAIVQRVVQRHGGRVWAEGKVNQGASFYFALPSIQTVTKTDELSKK